MNSMDNSDIKDRIIYQSDDCIVVNKLIGEAVEGASAGMVNLQKKLTFFLSENIEQTTKAKAQTDKVLIEAVNRLDVPVTGCALFALAKPSLVFFNNAFAGRNNLSVEKRYWAIIERPKKQLPQSAELVHWIETNSRINKSFAYNVEASARKKAALRYRLMGEGENYLFLEIELLSGRHHQIRAQLAACGLHIKGDLKYGAKRSEKNGGIRLHASFLSFPNPLNTEEKISVTAKPPQMDNLWEAFDITV